jgi:hypothetical protein
MRTVGSEQITHRVHGSSAYDLPHINPEIYTQSDNYGSDDDGMYTL